MTMMVMLMVSVFDAPSHVMSSLPPSILYGAAETARSCSNLPPLQVHTHHPIIISSCHLITPSSFHHVTSSPHHVTSLLNHRSIISSSCLLSPPGSSVKYLMAFKRSYVRRSSGKCCDQSSSSSVSSSSPSSC